MTTPNDVPSIPPVAPPHRPADDTEEIYYEGSPLLRWELAKGGGWVLVGLVVIAGPIVVAALKWTQVAWYIYLIAVVIGLIFLFVPWLRAKTIRYKISNYRIDVEKGLVGKRFDTMELWHVEDLQLTQSPLERILGVGTVRIYSHADRTLIQDGPTRVASNSVLEIGGLPKPRALYEALKQRVIAVKRQRGVLKMDIPMDVQPDAGHGGS